MNTKYDHSTCERHQKDLPKSTQSTSEKVYTNASASMSHPDTRNKNKPKLPQPEEITLFRGCENKQKSGTSRKYASTDEAKNRPESRSVIGSYAQKTIPFRSASFSQVDYTSGKYIRSALGALKASLIKAKSPPPIAEDKRSRSSSPEPNKSSETNIWIPLKGPCERRSDLHFDTIDAAAMSNIILEEDNEISPTLCSFNPVMLTGLPAHARNSTFKENYILEHNVLKVGEMTTDSPQDESLTILSVENLFQDASNSLIPVPVYERSCGNSDNLHLADDWLNACEIDSEQILAELVSVTEKSKNNELPVFSAIHGDEMKTTTKLGRNANVQDRQSPTLDVNEMPAIAVTPGSSISGSSFEEAENAPLRHQSAGEYVVRKRNSAGNNAENRHSDGTHSASTSGTNSPKSYHDEKRRIDKSKRRKGVYIQWAALDKHNKELSSVSWTPSSHSHQLSDGSGQPMWTVCAYQNDENVLRDDELHKESHDALSLIAFVGEREKRTEQHANDTEPCTPDSDCGRQQLIWQHQELAKNRRQSLTLQSSEEKDESPSTSSPPTSKPPSKLFVLRSDSCSDNELSDKSPSSRERASQSPAPDQDLKRYSKRPLRGPYGQMLEAEMKKPAKQNYDGLLEELNRSER